ncbi:MAG: cytidine deaminase family protein [Blastocatellia bacterium]
MSALHEKKMTYEEFEFTEEHWNILAEAAWECRERAYIMGEVKVGAAVMSSNGKIFAGCNVEHVFRSHDVHAEVNAITSMVAAGHIELAGILIVAERERFTPCGSCLDWIYQFGGPQGRVGFQAKKDGPIALFRTTELIPYYPR